MATRTDNQIRELNPEEWAQRVDEQARKYLGMSGEEFERRLRAGEIGRASCRERVSFLV